MARLEQFVAEWVTGLAEVPVIHIDAAADDCFSAAQLAELLARLDDG